MKYYSDKTNKLYDSEKSLLKAEKDFAVKEAAEKEKRERRATRAKEVEDAYRHAEDLLEVFIDDYGSFHTSVNKPISVFDILDRLF